MEAVLHELLALFLLALVTAIAGWIRSSLASKKLDGAGGVAVRGLERAMLKIEQMAEDAAKADDLPAAQRLHDLVRGLKDEVTLEATVKQVETVLNKIVVRETKTYDASKIPKGRVIARPGSARKGDPGSGPVPPPQV